jgi:hypothetical protein
MRRCGCEVGRLAMYHWPTDTPEATYLRSVERAWLFSRHIVQLVDEEASGWSWRP